MNKLIVKQDPEKEVPVEIIAQAIVDIGKSMKRIAASKLNRKAILVLVKADTNITMDAIGRVLDSLEQLEKTYCK